MSRLQKWKPLKSIFAILLLSLIWSASPIYAVAQKLQPGDLVLTEFMPSSSIEKGYYIELYNRRSFPIDIDGLKLQDHLLQTQTIEKEGGLTVPAESFVVLAGRSDPGGNGVNQADYIFSGLSLSDDKISLQIKREDGTEILRLDYLEGVDSEVGAGRELISVDKAGTDGRTTTTDYKKAESIFGINGDLGSPGTKGSSILREDPTVRFLYNEHTVSEERKTGAVEVLLEDPDDSTVEVDVNFKRDQSGAGQNDFIENSPVTITFLPSAEDGEKRAVFPMFDDDRYEGTEEAVFGFSNLVTNGRANISGTTISTLSINDNETPDVVISEVFASPATDVNGNGSRDAGDQFIEIYNKESVDLDIGNWSISDKKGTTYTFDEETILKANRAAVVFGNSKYSGEFGGSLVRGGKQLELNADENTVTLSDDNGITIDFFTFGEPGEESSLVRSPDGSGTIVKHKTISSNYFSPGIRYDGTNFSNSLTITGNSGWRILSSPITNLEIAELVDDVNIIGFGDGLEKNFYVGYDGTGYYPPSSLSSQLSSGTAVLLYFRDRDGPQSSTLPLTIDVTARDEPRTPVSVSLHGNGDKWNLVGNPFSSPIDVSNIAGWTSGGALSSSVGQIWDGNKKTFVTTTATNNTVGVWEGFYIQNEDAVSLDIPFSAKTTEGNYFTNSSQSGYLALKLEGEDPSTGRTSTDMASVLYFSSNAEGGWDHYDVPKLEPLSEEYALLNILGRRNSEKVAKAQDSRPYDFNGKLTYQLDVALHNIAGEFELSWSQKNLPENWSFMLRDNDTGAKADMNLVDSYTFSTNPPKNIQGGAGSGQSGDIESLPQGVSLNPIKQKATTNRFTIIADRNIDRGGVENEVPEDVKLNPNYPNPFNPTTTIPYELKEETRVKLSVWNIVGQKVATLVDNVQEAGKHEAVWNASDMPSGMYIIQLEVNGEVFNRKITLIK